MANNQPERRTSSAAAAVPYRHADFLKESAREKLALCMCPNDLPTFSAHEICAFTSPANWTRQTKLTCGICMHIAVFTSFAFKVLDFYGSTIIDTA